MGPSKTLSSSTDFLGAPVIRFPCSADFATGRGGFLQLLCVSLPSCCRFDPARVNRRFSQMRPFMLPSPSGCGLGLWGHSLSRPYCVHFRYRPMACHHPLDDAVNRFQRFGFPPPCYSSYEASDFYLGGFYLPLNTPAFAGHTTGRAHFEHPALRQNSLRAHGRAPRTVVRRLTPNGPKMI